MLRIAGITSTSLFDGYGVNYVIYTQGCKHKCEGCHNPSTHSLKGGQEVALDYLKEQIKALNILTGVTFSGGDPVLQLDKVQELAKWCKENNLQTTLYTGFLKDELPSIDYFDYIIDGKFEIDKKSRDCPFRGSTNQRIYKL